MEDNKTLLRKYHTDITCMLSVMSKKEALNFFSKYTFDADDLHITALTDHEIDELYNENLNDENIDDYNESIINNTIEYTESIIDDINQLDDDSNLYIDFEQKVYDDTYIQLMKEKIFNNNQINIHKICIELLTSYFDYLKIPKKYRKYGEINLTRDYSLTNIFNKFFSDNHFSSHMLLAYNCLIEYEIEQNILKISNQRNSAKNMSTINDVIRSELINQFNTLFDKGYDRIEIFEIIYTKLTVTDNFYTDVFDSNDNTPLCSNNYAKLLIMNDSYLMSKVILKNDNDTIDNDKKIDSIYDNLFSDELIKQFNTDKSFALRTFLLFIQFNEENFSNKSKISVKRTYGNQKTLQKINKFHFLDYISNHE